jgi:hypothetical protein
MTAFRQGKLGDSFNIEVNNMVSSQICADSVAQEIWDRIEKTFL